MTTVSGILAIIGTVCINAGNSPIDALLYFKIKDLLKYCVLQIEDPAGSWMKNCSPDISRDDAAFVMLNRRKWRLFLTSVCGNAARFAAAVLGRGNRAQYNGFMGWLETIADCFMQDNGQALCHR